MVIENGFSPEGYTCISATPELVEYEHSAGVTVGVNPEVKDALEILTAPWEPITYFNGKRAFEIRFGSNEYFVKYHEDKPLLAPLSCSSREEILIAQQLQQEVPYFSHAEIRFIWEKPIGYARYLDEEGDLEYAVFAKEPNFDRDAHEESIAWIMIHRDEYEDEFHNLNERMLRWSKEVANGSLRNEILVDAASIHPLSFEEFAYVKTVFLISRAMDARDSVRLALGYEDRDGEYNYGLRFNNGAIEVVSFDFHYYQPIENGHEKAMEREERHWRHAVFHTIEGAVDKDRRPHTDSEKLAYNLLLVAEGERLREKRQNS